MNNHPEARQNNGWNPRVIQEEAENARLLPGREPAALESVDDRMIGLMRLILALSALLIIYIDPSEPDRLVALTYGALIVYSLYSLALYLSSLRLKRPLPGGLIPWVDVGCFLVLVALSSGTSSIFFFFFFFAILVASFRWGFRAGFRITLASALLFTVVGYATAPVGTDFELNRFLLRPIYLLVLGYMIAYWGGREIRFKRRLRLLEEITRLSNPRFGVSHTVGSMLTKLLAFYGADRCLLLLFDPRRGEHRLFSCDRGQPTESVRGERLPPVLTEMLLSFPEDMALIHRGRPRIGSLRNYSDYGLNLSTKKDCTAEWAEASAGLAAQLETDSFVSTPLNYRDKVVGRLYLLGRRGIFDNSDVDFLMQVVEQVMPVIHNIRLLDQLAFNAAEQERQRLARDIHDSVIQPYIGLQYKLAAVRNKLAAGEEVSADVERLFQVTVNEVAGLRGFVRGLKARGGRDDDFTSAVRRFATHFAESYDLEVEVESRGEICVGGRVAAELIKVVHEGLSNIRKHAQASSSKITIERAETSLRLYIENDDAREDEAAAVEFVPVSIAERAEELGGTARVERSREGRTVVKVEIPL